MGADGEEYYKASNQIKEFLTNQILASEEEISI